MSFLDADYQGGTSQSTKTAAKIHLDTNKLIELTNKKCEEFKKLNEKCINNNSKKMEIGGKESHSSKSYDFEDPYTHPCTSISINKFNSSFLCQLNTLRLESYFLNKIILNSNKCKKQDSKVRSYHFCRSPL